jgi:hypothetical protein
MVSNHLSIVSSCTAGSARQPPVGCTSELSCTLVAAKATINHRDGQLRVSSSVKLASSHPISCSLLVLPAFAEGRAAGCARQRTWCILWLTWCIPWQRPWCIHWQQSGASCERGWLDAITQRCCLKCKGMAADGNETCGHEPRVRRHKRQVQAKSCGGDWRTRWRLIAGI